jgi:hypothetical protein
MKIDCYLDSCLFNAEYVVLCGGHSFLRKRLRSMGISHSGKVGTCWWNKKQGRVVLSFHKSVTLDVVVHEITHARQCVFEDRGLYDTSTGVDVLPWGNAALAETEAYYQGWLFNQVRTALSI